VQFCVRWWIYKALEAKGVARDYKQFALCHFLNKIVFVQGILKVLEVK
jgi:hypothetical protein